MITAEKRFILPLACLALASLLLFCLLLHPAVKGNFTTHAPAKSTEKGGEAPQIPHSIRICVDAGHGGADAGAVGEAANGVTVREKDLTLAVAQKLGARLSACGFSVIYTRSGDRRMCAGNAADELRARLAFVAEEQADLLLSLHANAYRGAGRAYGARVYYNPENQEAARAAALLAAHISQHTGRLIGRDARTEPDASYAVLRDSARPALLVEMGFLTDAAELALMQTEEWQNAFADAVCEALVALTGE